jgi:hypothetical protein
MRRMMILKKVADLNTDSADTAVLNETIAAATLAIYCAEDDVSASLVIPKANANGTYQMECNTHIYQISFDGNTVEAAAVTGSSTANIEIYKLG